jgi:hypothetical protein
MSELRGSPAQSDAANTSKESGEYTEMKFLHMILTKDKDYSLMLHAIHSPFYWRILQKIILYSAVLKLHTEKSEEQIKNPGTTTKTCVKELHLCCFYQREAKSREDRSSVYFLFTEYTEETSSTVTKQTLEHSNPLYIL